MHKREQGVVLIVALFIVALVAGMAYMMVSRLERDIRIAGLLIHNVQAEYNAQASVAWAMDQLRNDWERQKANRMIDAIPIQSPENEVNGYHIKSIIYDMQARFNLMNLTNEADTEAQLDFKRLLQAVDESISLSKAEAILKDILEWMSQASVDSESQTFYSELKTPYRIAHRPMISISELRLIKSMTPVLFDLLAPYVTILPVTTPVNVQTAALPVLMSLDAKFSKEAAKTFEAIRKQTPILSNEMFNKLEIIVNHGIKVEKKITTSSQYFLVETIVAIENQQLVLYTLLERITDENKVGINVLWQSKGVW